MTEMASKLVLQVSGFSEGRLGGRWVGTGWRGGGVAAGLGVVVGAGGEG